MYCHLFFFLVVCFSADALKCSFKSSRYKKSFTAFSVSSKTIDDSMKNMPIPNIENRKKKIVLIAGFEQFNSNLYKKAAEKVATKVKDVEIFVFTDADISSQPRIVADALKNADVLFASLIFDFQQITWLKERIVDIPSRFCFESALELMSETKVGEFQMNSPGGGAAGPPAPVKAILKQFGSGKEEDRLSGYLKFLKFGPKLLSYVPGKKAKDLKTWLSVYSYWNQGAADNVESMFYNIIRDLELVPLADIPVPAVVRETPLTGIVHPDLQFGIDKAAESPKAYSEWYELTHPWVTDTTPRVGILLYRKHVITEQKYIPSLIRIMEEQGIMPIPIFINGVEAHTIVRDQFTTHYEQEQLRRGRAGASTLSDVATKVDAIVNTIGFPLVGGPAGSMEGGRQIEVAKEILASKNVPYIVSAPLLIQDIESWKKVGVQGLQTVVLYSLPELDGAIEPIVLGGLVNGDQIDIEPERVRKLAGRLKAWVRLRQTAPADRKIAIIVYGFPPNVGAVGTAALLNVGNSLRNVLLKLHEDGYSLGEDGAFVSKLKQGKGPSGLHVGDHIISALRTLSQEMVYSGGLQRAKKRLSVVRGDGGLEPIPEASVVGCDVTPSLLREWLGDSMALKIENQWGDLDRYTGLGSVSGSSSSSDSSTHSTGSGTRFSVLGIEVGNIAFFVQPLVGVEGDPMRLLFDRDLTPHPQYAAFYKWLGSSYKPSSMVHFGMHGTVEWLPGSPLGNTADSWSDVLLSSTPNIYIYACNNPSESILAKRRGYATIVSHNVPSYSRSGKAYALHCSLRGHDG